MNIVKFSILTLLLTITSILMAQTVELEGEQELKTEEVNLFESSAYKGKVKIHQSKEIKTLVEAQKASIKKQNGYQGYRIRIFAKVGSGSRKKAEAIKIEFKEKFENIEPHLQYNNPNWEVHVGDFRTRMEAMQQLDAIKAEFAQAFIIKSIVNFQELEVTQTQE